MRSSGQRAASQPLPPAPSPVTASDFGSKCPQGTGGTRRCPQETPPAGGEEPLQLELPVRLHAEGLQPLALGQHAVEPLHQGHGLVYAHLDAAEDGGHFVDFLDLLRVLGIPFLALLHEAKEGFYRKVHL